ncbi:MAG: endonuclease/exonuclease/phosphatase family protein [Rhizobiaceae bacterium]|nr:endonuclease/exonuclease/phosphatase family protein [Rhizobiaceae bacterium]
MAKLPEHDVSPQEGIVAEGGRTAVRLMTWNIHGGVGLDGRRDLERIVSVVRRHAPDIVALQEVGGRGGKPGAAEAFVFLAEMLGSNIAESRVVTASDGDYGHVVISRWPLDRPTCHDLSWRRREPRAAVEATAQTPAGPLRLVAAHLGLSFAERRHQAALLSDIVLSGPHPTVLLGDFNDWIWRGSVQSTLNRLMPGHSHAKTFPSFCPLFALDRIYCRPTSALIRSWTDKADYGASDHLPVIAEVAVGSEAAASLRRQPSRLTLQG